MKCPYCDQEVADGSAVCPICGKELAEASANGSEKTETPETMAESEKTEEPVILSQTESTGDGAAVSDTDGSGKKKKWIIPAVIAAVAVVAVGAFAMTAAKNPKDVVIDAFKSITASGQTNPSEEIFGAKEMTEKLNKESSEVMMDFTVEGSSNATMNQLATGKLGMTALNDVENNKMFFSSGVGYADMNLVNLEFYLDDKMLVMAVPEISSKAFKLNYAEDVEGQVNSSPFVGPILKESGLDIKGLNNYLAKCNEMASSGNQLFDLKELWNRYKEGSKAIDDLKAAMTVEKADKKNFTIDGKEVSCKGYNVVVTKDALIQFITTTKDFFLSDETLKKDFIEYMKLVTELQGTMVMLSDPEMQSPEEMQEQIWEQAETKLGEVIEQLKDSMGDVTMNVYVRKDGKMAGFDYSTTAVVADEDIKLYGDVAFGGGYNMLSNVKAVLNIEDESGEVITLSLDKTGTYEAGKTWTGALTATATNGEESYRVVYEGDYAVEDGTYNVSLDFLSDEDSQLTMTSNGMFNDLEKGKSFVLVMDSIKLESSLATGDSQYVELSGNYKAGPLEQTVKVPEGEEFDILAATEDDYNGVYLEITSNAIRLMNQLYQ